MKYNEICPKCGKRTLFIEGKATVISALRNEKPYSFVVKEGPDLAVCWVRCGSCAKVYTLSELEASEQVWIADVRVVLRAENEWEASDMINDYFGVGESPFIDWCYVPYKVHVHSLEFGAPCREETRHCRPRAVEVPTEWTIESEEIQEAFPHASLETMEIT